MTRKALVAWKTRCCWWVISASSRVVGLCPGPRGLKGPGDPLGRDEGSSAVGLDRSKVPVGAISYIVYVGTNFSVPRLRNKLNERARYLCIHCNRR
jgi:hypothetical protein